jgi:hypothetical protein
MQEAPFCRPHLYLTYAEAYKTGRVRDTGIETSFPQPDNLVKLQLSMDSAKSQGLFPPGNGSSTGSQRGMMNFRKIPPNQFRQSYTNRASSSTGAAFDPPLTLPSDKAKLDNEELAQLDINKSPYR